MPALPPLPDPRVLRREMRAHRRALRASQQRAAARRLARAVTSSVLFLKARRIAVYMAADGEIDPAGICRKAWQLGKQVYLPVLPSHGDSRLSFLRYKERAQLRVNRFGIPEPRLSAGRVQPWQLDLVLMPLVAVDAAGNRLGMGGGFYDRTFNARLQATWPRRPRLAGLAHTFQCVPALVANPWDVPVGRVFTG